MKKITSFILALALTVGLLTAPAGASQLSPGDDLETLLSQQLNAYGKSLDIPNADDAAVRVLVNNSLKDDPADLHFGAGDAVTATVLNSKLFQSVCAQAIAIAARWAIGENLDTVYTCARLCWYDDRKYYEARMDDKEIVVTGITAGQRTGFTILPSNSRYTGPTNEYDDALCLVVGGSDAFITLERTAQTGTEITFDVSIRFADEFSFDSDYSHADANGHATENEKFINLMAKLFGLSEFDWEVTLDDFRITVPYTCSHTLESCAYTFENGVPAVQTAEGLTQNQTQPVTAYYSDGSVRGFYYRMSNPAHLRSDVPWTVEFTTKGGSHLILGSGPKLEYRKPYLMRTLTNRYAEDGRLTASQHFLFVGESIALPLTPEEQAFFGTEKNIYYGSERIGFDFSQSYDATTPQTVRYENRIAADGTNAIHIFLDGVELGAVSDRHFTIQGEPNTYYDSDSDWSNGRNIEIGYIGNENLPLSAALKELKIYENGTPVGSSAFTENSDGSHTCRLCGLTRRENEGAAVYRNGDTLTVETTAPDGTTVLAAAYENGRLTGTAMTTVKGGTAEIAAPGGSGKLFFLNADSAPVLSPLEF